MEIVIPKPEIIEDKLAKKENDDLIESQKFDEDEIKVEEQPVKKQIKISRNNLFLLKGRSS